MASDKVRSRAGQPTACSASVVEEAKNPCQPEKSGCVSPSHSSQILLLLEPRKRLSTWVLPPGSLFPLTVAKLPRSVGRARPFSLLFPPVFPFWHSKLNGISYIHLNSLIYPPNFYSQTLRKLICPLRPFTFSALLCKTLLSATTSDYSCAIPV